MTSIKVSCAPYVCFRSLQDTDIKADELYYALRPWRRTTYDYILYSMAFVYQNEIRTVIHSVSIRFFAKHVGNCVVHGSQLCAFSKLISFQYSMS